MSIQFKRYICVSIVSCMIFQMPAYAFNQVIEDFDAYLKAEEAGSTSQAQNVYEMDKAVPVKVVRPQTSVSSESVKPVSHEQKIIKELQAQLKQTQEKAIQAETDLQLLHDSFAEKSNVANDHNFLALIKRKLEMPIELSELLKSARQFSDERVQALELQIRSKQDEIQNVKSELMQLKQESIANQAVHQANFDQKLAQLTTQLNDKDIQLVKSARALEKVMGDRTKLETALAKITSERKGLETELAQVKQRSVSNEKSEKSNFDQQLAEMNRLLQAHETDLASKVHALEKLAQDKKAVEVEIVQLQKSLKSTSLDKYQLKKVRTQLEEKKEALMQAKLELRATQENYANMQKVLADANQQVDQIKSTLKDKDERLAKVDQDKSVLEQKLAQLEADVKKGNLQATGEMDQTAQKFLTKAYKDIEGLHEEIRMQAENYDKIHSEMRLREEEIIALRNELETIRWQRNKTEDLTKQLINSKQKKCVLSENQEYQIGCI